MVSIDILGGIGVLVTLATFWFGILQYANSQRWRRLEFVAGQVREFEADPKVRTAMKLLDWNSVKADKLPCAPPANAPRVLADAHLQSALLPHYWPPTGPRTFKKDRFAGWEFWARDVFDTLLDHLARFANYERTRLVKRSDLRPYLGYWLALLTDPGRSAKGEEVHRNLSCYIRLYYPALPRFFRSLGYALPEGSPVAPVTVSTAQPEAADLMPNALHQARAGSSRDRAD